MIGLTIVMQLDPTRVTQIIINLNVHLSTIVISFFYDYYYYCKQVIAIGKNNNIYLLQEQSKCI